MKNETVIFEKDTYRIIAIPDPEPENILDGDYTDEEIEEYRHLIEQEGAFGFVLEQWDTRPGYGWTTVDSCWGFIGLNERDGTDHYIIDELKSQIP